MDLTTQRFPRSARYDLDWMVANQMGPNAVWLTELLSEVMDLHAGMRVLDMGCGRALSSVFLARELDVEVWATDLWIAADENRRRIEEAGLQHRIFPIHAEAHALPYASAFFDAAVSMDAFHYFGTDDLYLGYYSRFVKPNAQLGIVVPGVRTELEAVPEHLLPYWVWDFCSFHSAGWWGHHWEKTGLVDVERAEWIEDGWRFWQAWQEICQQRAPNTMGAREAEMLREDNGRTLGFVRMVARRRERPAYGT